jgi:hypothetical protein
VVPSEVLAVSAVWPAPRAIKGPDYVIQTTLKPGETLTGRYSAWGVGGGYMGDAVSFRVLLPAAISAANVHFNVTNTFTATCPALGQAQAGHLCVYERAGGNRTFGSIYKPGDLGGPFGAEPEGFGIYFDTTGTGGSWSYGEWVVTAPASAAAAATAAATGSSADTSSP